MSRIDAVILFSADSPEPVRAAWLEAELRDKGLMVRSDQYDDISRDLIEALYDDTRHVIVLFSAATVRSAGEAFVGARVNGRKPLPVRCDSHPKYSLMADLVHVDIMGDPSTDKSQFDKLVRAIRAA